MAPTLATLLTRTQLALVGWHVYSSIVVLTTLQGVLCAYITWCTVCVCVHCVVYCVFVRYVVYCVLTLCNVLCAYVM